MCVLLPQELILGILRELSVNDLLNVRKTCRELYMITQDNSLWNYILSNLLSLPLRYAVDMDSSLWPEQLRQRAIIAARVDEAWHDQNLIPRDVQFAQCKSDIKDVLLLPGGEWMVSLFQDGALQVQAAHSTAPAFMLATDMKSETLTSQGSSVHLSPSQEVFVLYAFTNGIRLYHVDVHSQPPVQLAAAISDSDLIGSHYGGRVFVGGNMLALLCFDDYGSVQLYLKTFGSYTNPTKQSQEGMMTLGVDSEELLSPDQCMIQILSPDRLLMSTCQNIYMYEIPNLILNATPPASASLDYNRSLIKPLWADRLDSPHPGGSHPTAPSSCYGSPVVWSAPKGSHTGPLMIWRSNPDRVTIVEPSQDLTHCTTHSFPAPFGAQGVVSGLRHGMYVTNWPTEGLSVNLFTFPDLVSVLGADKEKVREREKGGGRLGEHSCRRRLVVSSFAVGPGNATVLASTFDEWSGRICLCIEDGGLVRRTYTVMIDIV